MLLPRVLASHSDFVTQSTWREHDVDTKFRGKPSERGDSQTMPSISFQNVNAGFAQKQDTGAKFVAITWKQEDSHYK